MFNNFTIVSGVRTRSDDELRRVYGDDAVISRVGKYNLIHLDNPSPEELEKRIAEFDPEALFDDDCPICRLMREEPGDIVYDDYELCEEDEDDAIGE